MMASEPAFNDAKKEIAEERIAIAVMQTAFTREKEGSGFVEGFIELLDKYLRSEIRIAIAVLLSQTAPHQGGNEPGVIQRATGFIDRHFLDVSADAAASTIYSPSTFLMTYALLPIHWHTEGLNEERVLRKVKGWLETRLDAKTARAMVGEYLPTEQDPSVIARAMEYLGAKS